MDQPEVQPAEPQSEGYAAGMDAELRAGSEDESLRRSPKSKGQGHKRSRSRSSHRHKSKSKSSHRHKHHSRDASPSKSRRRSRSRHRHHSRDGDDARGAHSNGRSHRSRHGRSRSRSRSASPDALVHGRGRQSSPVSGQPHWSARQHSHTSRDIDKWPRERSPRDRSRGRDREEGGDRRQHERGRGSSRGMHEEGRRDSSRGRDRDRSRGRARSQDGNRSRGRSQDRSPHHRGRDRSQDRSRGSHRGHSRDRSRGRGRERSRDRSGAYSPPRHRDYSRDRSGAYSPPRHRDYSRDRSGAYSPPRHRDYSRGRSRHDGEQRHYTGRSRASDAPPPSAAEPRPPQQGQSVQQAGPGKDSNGSHAAGRSASSKQGKTRAHSPVLAEGLPPPPTAVSAGDVSAPEEASRKLPPSSPSRPAAVLPPPPPRQLVKLSFEDDEEQEAMADKPRGGVGAAGGGGGGGSGNASTPNKAHKRQVVVTPNPNANIVRLSVPEPLTSQLPPTTTAPLSSTAHPQQHKLGLADVAPPHPALHYSAHTTRASNIILMDDGGHVSGSSSGLSCSSDVDEDDISRRGRPEVKAGRMGRVVFGVAQARCGRPYMEDRHCCVACWRPQGAGGRPIEDGVDRSYVGVFDGHNGSRTAEQAAARLHSLLASDPAFRIHTGDKGPPAAVAAEETAISGAIKRAFRTFDDDILRQEEEDGGRDGATALVLLRIGDMLYVAHAGDSRAVLCKSGGVAQALTIDHKPGLPEESQRVKAAGGQVMFQRCWRVVVEATLFRPGSGLAVSRSLGDIDFKRPLRLVESLPDVKQYMPRPGDAFVVLATDGLWDVLSDQDAVDVVRAALKTSKGPTTTEVTAAAEAALNLAIQRGTVDNVTVVVMALTWGTA